MRRLYRWPVIIIIILIDTSPIIWGYYSLSHVTWASMVTVSGKCQPVFKISYPHVYLTCFEFFVSYYALQRVYYFERFVWSVCDFLCSYWRYNKTSFLFRIISYETLKPGGIATFEILYATDGKAHAYNPKSNKLLVKF